MRLQLAIQLLFVAIQLTPPARATTVDLTAYDRACGIAIESKDEKLRAEWTSDLGKTRLVLNLAPNTPLFSSLELAPADAPIFKEILRDAALEIPITIGSRGSANNKFTSYVFFDKPAGRKHETLTAKLDISKVTVTSAGPRAVIHLSTMTAGVFSGELQIHLFAGSPLIRVVAALTPDAPGIAYIYDALISGGGFTSVAFENVGEQIQTRKLDGDTLKPLAVHCRTLIGQSANGSLAIFPTPHAFFFPRDRTDNFSFAQFDKSRFGLRQDLAGGGAFVPWIDGPQNKTQLMDFFLMPSTLAPQPTIERIKRYTHSDTYVPMDGRLTFTSHFHSRLTVGELAKRNPTREFAYVFKKMGVNIVHLAEFHGDGHPDDMTEQRLNEMKTMFELCRTFSDDKFLLLPGEEGNKYLGHPWPAEKGVHPGHWIYFLPKHVYLTWKRNEGQPFSEQLDPFGKVYHVGSRDDMVQLLKEETGVAWTTHPRIKASFATPDIFKDTDFYKSPVWLGGAWKAMPADLSDDRLGRRCLNLLDDMSNWATAGGYPLKALPGEVDVFELDRNHELYGHMNINYMKLAQFPKPFPNGDASTIIKALTQREFFTTTGEILIHSFTIEGNKVRAELEWTFPLAFAELITGNGKEVKRQTIDLFQTNEFSRRTFEWTLADTNAKWIRLEVWDVARNGAYTQSEPRP